MVILLCASVARNTSIRSTSSATRKSVLKQSMVRLFVCCVFIVLPLQHALKIYVCNEVFTLADCFLYGYQLNWVLLYCQLLCSGMGGWVSLVPSAFWEWVCPGVCPLQCFLVLRRVYSGPRIIPMHVSIQVQVGTAPNLVPIQWNLTHFHCYFT